MTSIGRAFLAGAAALVAALPALAVDGGFAGSDTSYYEAAPEGQAAPQTLAYAPASGGLPASLYVVEAKGGVVYRALGHGAWQVSVEVAERPHEKVDAVYDMVLALALPVGATPAASSIEPKQGNGEHAAPLVYGGERIVLERNLPLESSWLPLLVGASGGLPDLSRQGYAWTLWHKIVRYDASAGAMLQAFASFDYSAEPGVEAPDPEHPDNAAYVITWIPTLEAVPPFAIRLDVVPSGKE